MNELKLNSELAEFVGIILGDGNINVKSTQITISGGEIDGSYVTEHIPSLIRNLFYKNVSFGKLTSGGLDCSFGSRQIGLYLIQKWPYLSHGKINCKIPSEFFKDKNLLRACIRGLFDTDGGLHRHHVKSAQLKFTNKRVSLVDSLENGLKQLRYKPCRTIDHKSKNTHALYLFTEDVKRYFKEIGSNNPKNKIKFEEWSEKGIMPLNIDIQSRIKSTINPEIKIINYVRKEPNKW
jgi:hypothetical protein